MRTSDVLGKLYDVKLMKNTDNCHAASMPKVVDKASRLRSERIV